MRCGGWAVGMWAGCFCVMGVCGCVSLDDYRRLEAQHRSLKATKEAAAQELFDAQIANKTCQTRNAALEREVAANNDLVANLRKENDLLEQLRKTAESALDDMAKKQTFGDISITGPKLPESLDAALKRFADEHPTSVVYDAARGTVKWKSDLLFPVGSDVVKGASLASLREFTEIIRSEAASGFEVIVVGHTDTTPIVQAATKAKHPTNWHLSAHRAIAVATVLIKNGYAPERVGIMGRGQYRPIADNSTPAGAKQNRRVEVYIVPKGGLGHAEADPIRWMDENAPAFARRMVKSGRATP